MREWILRVELQEQALNLTHHLYKAVLIVLFHRILNNNRRKEPINPLHLLGTKRPLEVRILQIFLLF